MPGTNDTRKKQLRPDELTEVDVFDAYFLDDDKVALAMRDALTELHNAHLRIDLVNDYVGDAAPHGGQAAHDEVARNAQEVAALWAAFDAFLKGVEPRLAKVVKSYTKLHDQWSREAGRQLRRAYDNESREIRARERAERAERGQAPSPTQAKLLQYLARDAYRPTYLAAVRNRRDDDPYHVSAPYGTVPYQTFDALRRRGWIEQAQESVSIQNNSDPSRDVLHADWRITNAGREAIGVPTVPTEGEEA